MNKINCLQKDIKLLKDGKLLSWSQETDSLETWTKLVVLRSYVENQAILEPIPLYRGPKCKQTKEQGSEDC